MFLVKYIYLVFLTILNVCSGNRRIVGGIDVKSQKKYVVYLVKAQVDEQPYDAWLCGGALVSPTFIITSAACVEDVKHLYAIAGYKKYVKNEDLEKDQCVVNTRKKVIYTCVPRTYELDYARLDKWSFIDIALVKVESPYSPNDAAFKACSYIPVPIQINYEVKYQEPGVDAMVLGWGHAELWRKPNDTKNYNKQFLQYASTMIQDKKACKKHYEVYTNMSYVIDNYMICTHDAGNINENGELILLSDRNATGCLNSKVRSSPDELGGSVEICEDQPVEEEEPNRFYEMPVDGTRKFNDFDDTKGSAQNTNRTRRANNQGICQNDHGGPLVTWVGSHEVLIGVASVFKVDSNYKCTGPYLFTSTQCNGAFLSCILEANKDIQRHARADKYRRDLCDSPPEEKGYDTVERHISWMNHPDGPADNENFFMRPQRPLQET